MKTFYAVFVLYRIFLGNKSSATKMSKRLTPVMATSLIKKVRDFRRTAIPGKAYIRDEKW